MSAKIDSLLSFKTAANVEKLISITVIVKAFSVCFWVMSVPKGKGRRSGVNSPTEKLFFFYTRFHFYCAHFIFLEKTDLQNAFRILSDLLNQLL